MKNLTLFFLGLCLIISACKDDEGESCTSASVAGVYMGVDACNENNVHDETITISVTPSANMISYEDDEGVTFTAILNDCETETVELDVITGLETKKYDLLFSEGEVRLVTEARTLGVLFSNVCARTLIKQ